MVKVFWCDFKNSWAFATETTVGLIVANDLDNAIAESIRFLGLNCQVDDFSREPGFDGGYAICQLKSS